MTHLDDSNSSPTPADTATVRQVGNGWTVETPSYAGAVLARIPRRWAMKAAALLNSCDTRQEQRTELARIRAALAA